MTSFDTRQRRAREKARAKAYREGYNDGFGRGQDAAGAVRRQAFREYLEALKLLQS